MYYGDTYDPDAVWAALGTYVACIAFFAIAVIAFMIWAYWRILSKAGYNGAWSLLLLIPGINGIASLGILLVLAFGDWPALRRPAYAPPAVPPYQPPVPPAGGAVPPGYGYQPTPAPAVAPPAEPPAYAPAPPPATFEPPAAPPVTPPAPAEPPATPPAEPPASYEPPAPPAPPAD